MNPFLRRLPRLIAVSCKQMAPPPSFPASAASFSGRPGTVVLVSGTSLDCARYNIVATDPWLTISSKEKKISLQLARPAPPFPQADSSGAQCLQTLPLEKETYLFDSDSLDWVDRVISHYKESAKKAFSDVIHQMKDAIIGGTGRQTPLEETSVPIVSGLFGYLSYDLKDRIEILPNTSMDQHLPDLYLCAPSEIHIHDRIQDVVFVLRPQLLWPDDDSGDNEAIGKEEDHPVNSVGWDAPREGVGGGWDQKTKADHHFAIDPSGFTSNFSQSEYIDAVERIIEYIRAGDIYQVNLSQRFCAEFQGDPYGLFLKLFEKNPAPFFAFVNAGDHQVISTSPERFLLQQGNKVETRPIKGTIRRGVDPVEDETLGKTLLESPKDDAELSMIVDLMRNDLGKVAKGGSVTVEEHKRLEPYENVFHLVSVIEGELLSEKSSIDLIRATFPGGSITGCPKIRSMEIIDELENVRRHVYTGSIGYISFHDTMDLSIAIRTAVVAGGEIGFSVGGGIVFDSDPEKEYEETLHKGKTLMETLVQASGVEPKLLNNGHVKPSDRMKHERTRTTDCALSQINSHDRGHYPTTRQASIQSGVQDDQIKTNAPDRQVKHGQVAMDDRLLYASRSKKAWINGKIVDENSAVIPIRYSGVQYGAGLFETMRVQKGTVLRLSSHLDRLEKSWQSLFDCPLPAISWERLIQRLIRLNGLEEGVAAVKLMAIRGDYTDLTGNVPPSVKGAGDFFSLLVRPYSHRLKYLDEDPLQIPGLIGDRCMSDRCASEGHVRRSGDLLAPMAAPCLFDRGLSLRIYPERRETPLAAHKSMNYLYYALAGSYAKARGDDEALILNGNGSVSETNTCALIAVKGRQLFFPESNFSLPSVTFSAVMDLFSQGGYDMVPVKMMPEDLKQGAFGAVYLLNALMGAVPVCSIDGLPLVGHGGGATPWDAGKNNMIEERKRVGSPMAPSDHSCKKYLPLCLCRWLNRQLGFDNLMF